MKKVAFLIFILFVNLLQGQNKTERICLHYQSSRGLRCGFSIYLTCQDGDSTASVDVISDTTKHQLYDSTFSVSKHKYEDATKAIKKITYDDVSSQFEYYGLDGTHTSIEFGSSENSIKYSIWGPDADTQKRKLTAYFEAYKLILHIAGMNPDDLFK